MSRHGRAAVAALAVGLAAVLTVAVAATAAGIEPRALVLQEGDLPPHYEFQPGSSGTVRAVGAPDALVRPGLKGGYYATYWGDSGSSKTIVSAAYVYRSASGSTAALAAVDRAARRNRPPSLARRPVRIGETGWLYTERTRDHGTSIVWRFGRVLAIVNCSAPRGHEKLALALARKQQRRVAAALR
jgi:hypothetical protein